MNRLSSVYSSAKQTDNLFIFHTHLEPSSSYTHLEPVYSGIRHDSQDSHCQKKRLLKHAKLTAPDTKYEQGLIDISFRLSPSFYTPWFMMPNF